jgi:DNA polymerase-1
LIAAHLLDENGEHGLKDLARQHLGVTNPLTFEEADRVKLIDPEVFEEYARNDARYTFRLWQLFKPELEAQGLMPVYELEKRLIPVVRAIEERGIKIDVSAMRTLCAAAAEELDRLKTKIFELAGCEFDLNKNKSVAAILYDKLNLECVHKTGKGDRSVDESALEEMPHPIAGVLWERKKIDKLANVYGKTLLEKVDENGRIHPEFNSLGAKTGRFTCRNPNTQQMPAKSELAKTLRNAFTVEIGNKLIVADYSQMELRVLTHFSQDPLLLKAYMTDEEVDLHKLTAQRMFKQQDVTREQRAIAKTINFGVIYGSGAPGLLKSLHAAGIELSLADCEGYIKTYFKTYKEVADFLLRAARRIKSRKHVETLHGRRRRLSGQTKHEVNQAQNFIIQATAADIFKTALIAVHESLPDGAYIVNHIHDEIVIECREDHANDILALTVEIMERAPDGFKVPMRVDARVVDRWGDAK